MKRWVFLIAVFLLLARSVSAAGTVTVTTRDIRTRGDIYRRYTVTWLSDGAGAVSGNAFAILAGKLVNIRFIPDGGGTQPDNAYDLTLAETSGVTDLTAGQGANLSNTTATLYSWNPPIVEDGTRTIDVVIAAAGASNGGTVVILVQIN